MHRMILRFDDARPGLGFLFTFLAADCDCELIERGAGSLTFAGQPNALIVLAVVATGQPRFGTVRGEA